MSINSIKFDEKGLIPVITQDVNTNKIIMFAWMNRESLKQTLKTGMMTYWSRSRQRLWVKGENSGNVQDVREIYIDCDDDCLLFKVESRGMGAACHEGYRSCFYRKVNLKDGSFSIISEKIFDPAEIYEKNNN